MLSLRLTDYPDNKELSLCHIFAKILLEHFIFVHKNRSLNDKENAFFKQTQHLSVKTEQGGCLTAFNEFLEK